MSRPFSAFRGFRGRPAGPRAGVSPAVHRPSRGRTTAVGFLLEAAPSRPPAAAHARGDPAAPTFDRRAFARVSDHRLRRPAQGSVPVPIIGPGGPCPAWASPPGAPARRRRAPGRDAPLVAGRFACPADVVPYRCSHRPHGPPTDRSSPDGGRSSRRRSPHIDNYEPLIALRGKRRSLVWTRL